MRGLKMLDEMTLILEVNIDHCKVETTAVAFDSD